MDANFAISTADTRGHDRQSRGREYGNWFVLRDAGQQPGQPGREDRPGALEGVDPDPKLDYTSTVAARVVVGNHIIVGIGGDHLDNPGFCNRGMETGALQWKWWTTPPRRAGSRRGRSSTVGARHRGRPWIPGTYDPELNLVYRGHRQSQSGDGGEKPQGRQPLHVRDCGNQPGHR